MKQVRATHFVYGGAIAGFLFVAFFVRAPWWLHGQMRDGFLGLIAMGFVFGGGYAGLQIYKRYRFDRASR